MARAVLDTSVLVSAFLTPSGVSGRLLEYADRGVFVLCLSAAIVAELRRVLLREPKLQRRYDYGEPAVDDLCLSLAALADLVTDLPDLAGAVPLDPKDDMVVATAVAAGADVLVTGDRRHLLALGQYGPVRILGPRGFLDELAAAEAR